eukprot:UN05740
MTGIKERQSRNYVKEAKNSMLLVQTRGTKYENGKKVGNSRILTANLPNYIFNPDERHLLSLMHILLTAGFYGFQLSINIVNKILKNYIGLNSYQASICIDRLVAKEEILIDTINSDIILVPKIINR